MKYFLFGFILLFPLFTEAQNMSFTHLASYDYQFIRDTLKSGDKKKTTMLLFLGKESSFFQSEISFRRDTALKRTGDVELVKATYGPSLVSFCVIKAYRDHIVRFYRSKNSVIKNESRTDQFHWQINVSMKKKIAGYACNMATLKFAGRNYIAWFSSELPFRDGPYKFCNLPGLILEIYDEQDHHHFTFHGFQANPYDYSFKEDPRVKEISMEKMNYYEQNPEALFSLMGISNVTSDGKPIDNKPIARNLIEKL